MSPFFPHETITWKAHRPTSFRRLTFSLVEMAVLTGIVLRLLRAVVLAPGPTTSWLFLGGALALATVLYFGMATLHLGNYTLRRWLWRVPAFAAVEAAAEMATSALLIALGREPLGTSRATFNDWPAMALDTLLYRVGALILFAFVLAGIVQVVRTAMAKRRSVTEKSA